MSHIRFQQIHKGVPVMGAELTIHLRGSNMVTVQAKTLPDLESINITPTVTPSDASDSARRLLAEQIGVTDAVLSTPSLEIFNIGIIAGTRTPSYLAWFIEATRPALREFIWIDAQTGLILHHSNQVPQALTRQIFDHQNSLDPALTHLVTTFPTGDAHLDNAYKYAADTYNFFFNVLGRDSYDGAGSPLILNVHYVQSVCSFATAFWSGDQSYYCGDQTVAIDVAGHEITHGVIQTTASLFYGGESGMLNEGYASILGESVDLTYGPAKDSPALRWK